MIREETAAGRPGARPGAVPDEIEKDGDASDIQIDLVRLDPNEREALVLTQILGLTYAEVAEVVGARPRTVGRRVFAARSAQRAAR